MKAKLLMLLLGSALIGQGVMAQSKSSLEVSLKSAQEYAVKNSYSTRTGVLDVAIAQKKRWEYLSVGLPQIGGSIQYQDMIDIPTQLIPDFISPAVYGVLIQNGLLPSSSMPNNQNQFFPAKFGTQHNATAGITATQLLFSGQYLLGVKAAKMLIELANNGLEKTELEVKQHVATTYYLILTLEMNRSIVDSSMRNVNKTLFEVKEMNKNGFVEESDVDQIQILATQVSNMQSSLQRQTELAYRLLKFQMGLEIGSAVKLTDQLDQIVNGIAALSVTSKAFNVQNDVNYRLMGIQERLTAVSVKNERYSMLPTLMASYVYQQKNMNNDFGFFSSTSKWYPTSILGVTLDIPIFSSWKKRTAVSRAKLELEKIRISKKMLEESLVLEYEQAKSNFNNAWEKFNKEKDNMMLSKRIHEKNLVKFKEGLTGSLELTQTQNQFLTSESNYFNALYELLTAKVNLDKLYNQL